MRKIVAVLVTVALIAIVVVAVATAGGTNWKTQIENNCVPTSHRLIGARQAMMNGNYATAERRLERGVARAKSCLLAVRVMPGS
jgi:hypothetical protein